VHAAVSVPGTFTGRHVVPMLSVVSTSHALVALQPHCGRMLHGCVAHPLPSIAASIGFTVSGAASLVWFDDPFAHATIAASIRIEHSRPMGPS
jgi:hypothetical protein